MKNPQHTDTVDRAQRRRDRSTWRLTWNLGLLLGVGLIVAGFAGLVAWTLWPAPPGPTDIRGRWRPANAANCAQGRILTIAADRITFSVPDPADTSADTATDTGTDTDMGADMPLSFETALEQTAKGPLLRLYLEGEPRMTNIRLQLDTHGDRLRFVSAEWAPEAKDVNGDALNTFPLAQLLHQLQKLQPMVPCE